MKAREGETRKALLVTLAIAVALGMVETVKGYVAGRSAPNAFGWTEAVLTNMPWWLLWAAVAPIVFMIARRWPVHGPDRALNISVHVVASILISAAHLAVSALLIWLAVSHVFRSLGAQVRELVVGYFIGDIVTYGAIVAGYGMYAAGRRLRAAEREGHELQVRALQLEAEAVELRSNMVEARLDALRLELNPHFLFNTLNAASALASQGRGTQAARVLAKLSDLLRHTLDSDGDHEVTLEDEIVTLEKYLAIERLRFGDRLETKLEIDPAVSGALVPVLILQPLVENAVRHGVSAVRRPVRIVVQAMPRGDDLEIRVEDTGPGFGEGVLTAPPEGIGLRNTRSRLAALYGDSARLEIRAGEQAGVLVRLVLPLRLEAGVRVEV